MVNALGRREARRWRSPRWSHPDGKGTVAAPGDDPAATQPHAVLPGPGPARPRSGSADRGGGAGTAKIGVERVEAWVDGFERLRLAYLAESDGPRPKHGQDEDEEEQADE